MSIDEYHRLPLEAGWKIEYWDGMARWTPRLVPVKTVLRLAPRPAVACAAQLRPLLESDRAPLETLYVQAFADSIEFCDCERDRVARQAAKDLANFFAGKEAPPLPDVSRVAVGEAGALAGAMLVREGKRGRAVSELLFIAPAWQRRGVGTALLTEVVNQLHAAGHAELVTGYALGSLASEAFFHRCGFVDSPSEWVAQKRLRVVEHELRRHDPGELSAAEIERLEVERDRWCALVAWWDAQPHEARFASRDE